MGMFGFPKWIQFATSGGKYCNSIKEYDEIRDNGFMPIENLPVENLPVESVYVPIVVPKQSQPEKRHAGRPRKR